MLRRIVQSVLAAVILAAAAPANATGETPKLSVAAQDIELTPEEKAERESRKACKVEICAAFHRRNPDGADIACSVVKSWRKEQLEKMISKARVSWPWGRVQCVADIRLKRQTLINAMTEPRYDATLDKHVVTCRVEREKGDAEIKFEFTPKVTFESGKATKAALNWGTIEAPQLVKGAMWTATATDNTFNVLEGTVVEDINDFVGNKCLEVKDDWQGK